MDVDDLCLGIMELGVKGLTPTDVVNLFNLIDRSGDGEIDYDEFILLIRVCGVISKMDYCYMFIQWII